MEIKEIGNSCGEVYHYTKLSSLVGIIRKEGIIFRAGRFDAMNDPYDSIFGAKTVLKEWGEEIAYAATDPNTFDISPYIVSFCKENDKPLMWRLYNADVTLHIDSDEVRSNCIQNSKMMLMGDVDYVSEKDVAKKVFDNFEESRKYFGNPEVDFLAKAKTSFIKVDDFKCEDEWRVAWFDNYDTYDDNMDSLEIAGDEIASEIKSDGTRYGGLHFYRELKFPTTCLKGITIRAYNTNDFDKIRTQIRIWLAQNGYSLKVISIVPTKSYPCR